MAARVDVRVDPDRDPRPCLARARKGVDAFEFSFRLGVDRLDAELNRLCQLGFRLPDTRKDDLRRDEPGPQRDVDLAARVGIDLTAQAS